MCPSGDAARPIKGTLSLKERGWQKGLSEFRTSAEKETKA